MDENENVMDIREQLKKKNFENLTWDQKKFVCKRVQMVDERIAKEHGISEETAFDLYMKGVFDA